MLGIENEPWYRSPAERAAIKPYRYMSKEELREKWGLAVFFLGFVLGMLGICLGIFAPETLWGILMLPGLALMWVGIGLVVLN